MFGFGRKKHGQKSSNKIFTVSTTCSGGGNSSSVEHYSEQTPESWLSQHHTAPCCTEDTQCTFHLTQNKSLFRELTDMTNQIFTVLWTSHIWLVTLQEILILAKQGVHKKPEKVNPTMDVQDFHLNYCGAPVFSWVLVHWPGTWCKDSDVRQWYQTKHKQPITILKTIPVRGILLFRNSNQLVQPAK